MNSKNKLEPSKRAARQFLSIEEYLHQRCIAVYNSPTN